MARRAAAGGADVDCTVYPEEEKVGAELLQRWIVELFRPLVERWLAERGVRALTGADQFIYFRRGDVRGRVPPDVFVLPGVRPDRRMRACASRPGASGDVLFPPRPSRSAPPASSPKPR